MTPLFLKLGTRWKKVINFTSRQHYPRGKSPYYLLYKRLVGPSPDLGVHCNDQRKCVVEYFNIWEKEIETSKTEVSLYLYLSLSIIFIVKYERMEMPDT
jgi:hypothetical protein